MSKKPQETFLQTVSSKIAELLEEDRKKYGYKTIQEVVRKILGEFYARGSR